MSINITRQSQDFDDIGSEGGRRTSTNIETRQVDQTNNNIFGPTDEQNTLQNVAN